MEILRDKKILRDIEIDGNFYGKKKRICFRKRFTIFKLSYGLNIFVEIILPFLILFLLKYYKY